MRIMPEVFQSKTEVRPSGIKQAKASLNEDIGSD
jgi:hypothetical protein